MDAPPAPARSHRMWRAPTWALLAALVLVIGAASACSSDSGDGAGDRSAPSATLAPAVGTEKPSDTSADPAAGDGAEAAAFTLTSSAFDDGESMPAAYGCDRAGGEGKSPPLAWSGVPDGTGRLVLVVHDPDAPLAGGFTHLVTTIPLDVTGLPDGANADAAGPMAKWIPACPPSGEHRYQFTLYAFGPNVDLPANPDKATVDAVAGDALATAKLTGLFAAPD